ncbi:MAG: hypothetical protein KF819_15835 [Labilithrix sp.]|nr:hypothetical protein [Labilithrix sp.]
MRFSLRLALVALAMAASGCRPSIGDRCIISTDCSTRGDRLCDTAQPGGYCTQFNCKAESCPEEAACVLFNPAVPGCSYDDRAGAGGSRIARSFCVVACETNDDCRSGYVCADPRLPPWNGFVQDKVQDRKTCLVASADFDVDGGASFTPRPPAPICDLPGSNVAPIDASAPTMGTDAGVVPPLVPDAGPGDLDAGDDASDGG